MRTRLAAALVLLALAAACTDEAPPADETDTVGAYAACMRDNGIEDYPDPADDPDSGGGGLTLPDSIDVEGAEFQDAAEACIELLPGLNDEDGIDPDVYEAFLEYVECMRTEGVTAYPDPEADRLVKADDLDAAGIDTGSESFEAAHAACKENLPPELRGQVG
ncbi:hypothetical protein [Glycomyces paridis]|uniref:Lipoprotein n=1 Tax=Glycomyces paridis TaxID=2126555 RepID=A0A4S8PH80_9ACTN|nr:hypothetical protein [Glycomyces paridis]THV29963.1 hypothetical protein E9998_06105 [Glycomyces paridis]